MSEHSLAETEGHLAELIDRALAGEEVVMARDGRPAVALRPVPAEAARSEPWGHNGVEWLARVRVGRLIPGDLDAGEFVSQMRDEEWR